MTETIDTQELKALIQSVFSPTADDRHLLLMVDVPDDALPDTDLWRIRRGLAQDWCGKFFTGPFAAPRHRCYILWPCIAAFFPKWPTR